jgi:hypothetical protein
MIAPRIRHIAGAVARAILPAVAFTLASWAWHPTPRPWPDGVIVLGRYGAIPICIETQIRACWVTEG